ncbi:hypothetical protein WMW72_10785 [Paenibacillus filicis]|uniref:Uncharacterized protein n=1 Tax=Paenibacillus filicis TaxID=669464 RepID=A0ABU9DHP4_9BACL
MNKEQKAKIEEQWKSIGLADWDITGKVVFQALREQGEIIEQQEATIRDKDEHIRALRLAKEQEVESHLKSCEQHQDAMIAKDKEIARLTALGNEVAREQAYAKAQAIKWNDEAVRLRESLDIAVEALRDIASNADGRSTVPLQHTAAEALSRIAKPNE